QRRARGGGVQLRAAAGAPHGGDHDPLPPPDRRRRPHRCPRGGRPGLRRARRVDPDGASGGPRRRRATGRRVAPRHRRRARRDRRDTAGQGVRPRRVVGDACRRRERPVTAHQWRGVSEEYRARLEIPEQTPTITLREGGTPLVESRWLSGLTGAEVWLKVEGNNPTGSFKDRGMTVALSVAVGQGAKAVVCASTGNTSASMAA